MAKKKDAKETKADGVKKSKAEGKPDEAPSGLGVNLIARAFPLVFVLTITYSAGSSAESKDSWLRSEVENKMNICLRFFFFIMLQAVATDFFAHALLQVARTMNGDLDLVMAGRAATAKELEVNDSSIPWPPVDLLSQELKPYRAKPSSRSFFLNHVKGRRRCKDAFMRIGMNLGSLLTVWVLGRWLDGGRPLSAIGLTLDVPFFNDMLLGFCVGITIVAFMFVVELGAGWLHFLQFFEVFDASENFSLNIFWDVLFHLNVSLNEELPVRGWMLYNLAEAFAAYMDLGPLQATVYAMIFQSVFFVMLHLPSPGGMRPQSMINIFVGGISGGLNVLCTGGRLGFALGWHFGWNISMGNVFGLSTSGIPISATFVSVAPLPDKESLHGGVFGPEGGIMAPFAYLLGLILLALLYGVPDATAAGGLLLSASGPSPVAPIGVA